MHSAYNTYYIYILNNINKYLPACLFAIFSFNFSLAQQATDLQLANEYYLKGEKKKAVELYGELAKSDTNIPAIHNNYFNLLMELGQFQEAQAYLRRLQRKDPENLQYKLDHGIFLFKSGDSSKADKHLRDIISQHKTNAQNAKFISDYLAARSLVDYSIVALTMTRSELNSHQMFSLELAMLYRLQGAKDKMVNEYLNYVTQSSANTQYVKNVLQSLLTGVQDMESLEKLLYQRIQQYPDSDVYVDLLIWVTMQQKNFYASFVQARAYDKRYKRPGDKCMEVARVAYDNKDYTTATRIYRYVAREYADSPNYLMARLGLIATRDASVKSTFPVNRDSVRALAREYQSFIEKYPNNSYALEAQRSRAILFANFLDDMDSAIVILDNLAANPRASQFLKAKAKLDLGDIYLLKGEPWESTLLYSQVEKLQRENTLGYDAKLKNAKLSYYQGNFTLAQEHLDILKEATTREIANDAMELSMRIKENLAYDDTTGTSLLKYASIELLLHQNKVDQALNELINFKSTTPRNYAILDDVYWLEADLQLKKGKYLEAIASLEKIIQDYSSDVYADDASFLKAEILEKYLGRKDEAQELYRQFLSVYPGSVYSSEARKRYRTLRGDFDSTDQIP